MGCMYIHCLQQDVQLLTWQFSVRWPYFRHARHQESQFSCAKAHHFFCSALTCWSNLLHIWVLKNLNGVLGSLAKSFISYSVCLYGHSEAFTQCSCQLHSISLLLSLRVVPTFLHTSADHLFDSDASSVEISVISKLIEDSTASRSDSPSSVSISLLASNRLVRFNSTFLAAVVCCYTQGNCKADIQIFRVCQAF